MPQERFDIVIVGGGMVGTTLAAVLTRFSYRVALLESSPFQTAPPPCFDDRAIALSWGSSRILHQLKLWSELEPQTEPIKSIHVSDRGHFGQTRICAEEEQVPALGYVIAAREFGKILISALPHQQNNSFRLLRPAKLLSIQIAADNAELFIEHEQQTTRLSTKLIVAADGTRSTVRNLLKIGSDHTDYQQNALIANVCPEQWHGNVAYERFTQDGPIALLPVQPHKGNTRCALIWTLPENSCQQLVQADDAMFLDRLQQQFGYRLGRFSSIGTRSVYPLSLMRSHSRITDRVLFVGNAAQTVHPVAGQGFNLALRDVSTLLDCLLYPEIATDPGAKELLMQYDKKRKRDQTRVIHFTDILIKAFSCTLPLAGSLRAAGLSLLDALPLLRRKLTRFGLNQNSPLPHYPYKHD